MTSWRSRMWMRRVANVAATLRGLYGAPIPGELSLRTEWWIAGIAIVGIRKRLNLLVIQITPHI